MLSKYALRKTTCLALSTAKMCSAPRGIFNLPRTPIISERPNIPAPSIEVAEEQSNPHSLKPDKKNSSDILIPISDMDELALHPQILSNHTQDLIFPKLPPLSSCEIGTNDFSNLLTAKLDICSQICDFNSEANDREAKVIKSEALNEILNLLMKGKNLNLKDQDYLQIIKMVENNIFRDFVPVSKAQLNYNDEPRVTDNSFPHLLKVYDILKTICELKPKLMENEYSKFLAIFHSPDLSEREYMAKIILILYKSCPGLKNDLINRISNMLVDYRLGLAPPFCVWPSLQFFDNLYQTEITTLSDTMKNNFWNVIVPLITTQHLTTFAPCMSSIFNQMISTSSSVSKRLLLILLRQFPIICSCKMVWFVEYLQVLCEKITTSDFQNNAPQIFKIFAKCAMCMNAKVTEASFHIWFNPKITPRLIDTAKLVFPIIHGSIVQASREHWNTAIQNKAIQVLKAMRDLNPFLYDEINWQRMQTSQQIDPSTARNTQKQWALIARIAAHQYHDVNLRDVLGKIQLCFNEIQLNSSITSSSGNTSPSKKPKIANPIKRYSVPSQWR